MNKEIVIYIFMSLINSSVSISMYYSLAQGRSHCYKSLVFFETLNDLRNEENLDWLLLPGRLQMIWICLTSKLIESKGRAKSQD